MKRITYLIHNKHTSEVRTVTVTPSMAAFQAVAHVLEERMIYDKAALKRIIPLSLPNYGITITDVT